VTEGEKMAQVALRFGADDLGGTLFEEVVVASTGVKHRVSVASLKRLAEDAGFRLARRDTSYKILEYVRNVEGSPRPRWRVETPDPRSCARRRFCAARKAAQER
jgi:2-iminoacetate synthase ThiH